MGAFPHHCALLNLQPMELTWEAHSIQVHQTQRQRISEPIDENHGGGPRQTAAEGRSIPNNGKVYLNGTMAQIRMVYGAV